MKNSANEEQKKVIESHEKNIVCLAGAGTGKTFTLISRIFYLIDELNIDPASILNLTFTNAAAAEMKSRYQDLKHDLREPYFGTFHAFCYNLLIIDSNILRRLNYRTVPKVIDEFETTKYYEMARQLTLVSLPKKAYRKTYKPTRKEAFEFKLFHKELGKLLRKDNKITFDILCYDICDLFIHNELCIQKYKRMYKFIQVDEFQDTDEIQWKFVQSFQGKSNIFICGDVNQCIYQFRGTTNKILKSLANDENWKVYKLEKNYRSTSEICKFANEIEFTKDVGIQMHSNKHGFPVDTLSISSFERDLKQLSDIKDSSIAILCRTNKEVNYLKKKLDYEKIEYSSVSKRSEYNLILSALDDEYYKEFLLSLCDDKQRANLIQSSLFYNDKNMLKKLKSRFPSIDRKIEDIQESDNFGDMRLLYELGEFQRYPYKRNVQEKGVYIGTIHSVKGLEFDSVYVYDVNTEYFKLQGEENRNIFYVACTRPKYKLVIVTDDPASLL